MGKLSGKTVLITGASSGIGLAMVELFASKGATLSLFDNNESGLKRLSENLKKKSIDHLYFTGDVSNLNDCENWVENSFDYFKKIDVLINNAGIMDDFMPIDKLTDELWNRVISVNLDGPLFLMRKVVPIFLKQSKGVILNIASVGGIYGARAGAAYTASKHALIGLSKNIAFMYVNHGIRCNAIAPGGVKTNIGLNMKPNDFGYQRCISGGSNMPRIGEPEEISKTALFLISDDSSFVNGSVVTVDGGWTAY